MNAKQIVNTLLEYGFPEGQQPEDQPHISVADIFGALPEEVGKQILDILNTEPDDIAGARKLRALLAPHAAALEKIGLIPDYTAYMLIHVANVMREQQAREHRRNMNN